MTSILEIEKLEPKYYEPDKFPKGLNKKVVESISHIKNEPGWVTEFRLKALEIFLSKPMPNWGFIPHFNIDLNSYVHYVGSNRKKKKSWEEVDPEVLESFERLGIPEHERKYLAGLEAMNDSETVYANVKKELEELGIIFCDIDTAIREYPDLVRKYLGTIVPPEDNKFAALNSAVFSGGSFAYVPKGVKTPMPLQAYFKVTAASSGQYERTLLIADEGSELIYSEGCTSIQDFETNFHTAVVELIAHKNARIHYTTIQNWKKNMYNWTVKRGICYEGAHITWNDVNVGAQTIKYPGIILYGDNSTGDVLSLAFAGSNQIQDTGARIIHIGKNTRSNILAKGVSLDGGINSYRGLVKFEKTAENSYSHIKCDGLMLDDRSESHAYPYNEVHVESAKLNYEATVSKIDEDILFYLQTRGIDEDEAKLLIVTGFCDAVVRDLNVEYSVEISRLIRMILEDGKAIKRTTPQLNKNEIKGQTC